MRLKWHYVSVWPWIFLLNSLFSCLHFSPKYLSHALLWVTNSTGLPKNFLVLALAVLFLRSLSIWITLGMLITLELQDLLDPWQHWNFLTGNCGLNWRGEGMKRCQGMYATSSLGSSQVEREGITWNSTPDYRQVCCHTCCFIQLVWLCSECFLKSSILTFLRKNRI